MLKASGGIAVATLTSRILGMVREMIYMNFMGIGLVNDAFQLAFTAPNLFRRLLGEGALTASFIPIFKEKEKVEGEEEMWRAANAVISGLVVVATGIVALVMFGVSIALDDLSICDIAPRLKSPARSPKSKVEPGADKPRLELQPRTSNWPLAIGNRQFNLLP